MSRNNMILLDWEAKSGTSRVAPPYSLVAPMAYPEAVNLNTPEYSLAQGLTVALHSLRFAFNSVSGCEPMPLGEAAEQLDVFLRAHSLTMIPPSDYYLANCRRLPT